MRILFSYILPAALGLLTSTTSLAGTEAFVPGTIPATYMQGLPQGYAPAAIALDADDNVLIAGTVFPPGSTGLGGCQTCEAFVAKVSPDGKTLLYQKVLGIGASAAIAVDGAGNAYVAGSTWSSAFPTTKGAWGAVYQAPNGQEAFVTKLDPAGDIVFSTLIGGTQFASAAGIAVNAAGESFVTGQNASADFPLVGGAIQSPFPANDYFLVRLSALGDHAIYSITGPGGLALTLDEQNNAYVVGAAEDYQIPVTPNAFQKTSGAGACGGSFMVALSCSHQYVCAVNATATTPYFCTFVSGSSGDSNPSIAIDSSHNIYLAGTTFSTDYPVTSFTLQAHNPVEAPPQPLNPPGGLSEIFWAFQPAGYFTELSADGTHLLYSTYFGGSQADYPEGIQVDAQGHVYIAALVQSPNYPGLPAVPRRCLPNLLHPAAVLAKVDGFGVQDMVVEGAPASALMAFDPNNGFWLASGGNALTHVPIDGASAPDAIACVVDAIDYTQAGPIAPGQLLTIFGEHLGPETALNFNPGGLPPLSLGGVTVTINGTASPLLYVSESQINLQVPANVAGLTAGTMILSLPDGATAQRSLPVAALNPTLANNNLDTYATCNGQSLLGAKAGGFFENPLQGYGLAEYALVVNPDGSANSCSNPAPAGSLVRVVLNGAGLAKPAVTDAELNAIEGVMPVPQLPGVWAVAIKPTTLLTPSSFDGGTLMSPLFTQLYLSVNGTPVREQAVAVWLKP